jgi:hypothetical protein
MNESNGSPVDADARLRHVYVGRECPCGGDSDCETCEGEGDVGELVTLEAFRRMASIRAGDRPSLVV